MKALALALVAASLLFGRPAGAIETPPNFVLHEMPKPVPEISFKDGDGNTHTLADYAGRVVLLNIWATWCLPCREEMPTLDRLQAELGGPDFQVVALSIDRAGPDVVKKFFADIGIRHLALDIDVSGEALFSLGILGLPATLLIDRQGREVGRLSGPADWDTPEMVALIRSHIAKK